MHSLYVVVVVLVLVVIPRVLPKDRDLEFGAWLIPPKLRFRVVHNGQICA